MGQEPCGKERRAWELVQMKANTVRGAPKQQDAYYDTEYMTADTCLAEAQIRYGDTAEAHLPVADQPLHEQG
jgi:hypothetical protein